MTLAASNLTIERKDEFYLNDISFEMSPGKIYTIIGRTLSGKTTLLKTIAGLISQDSGKLTFNANDFDIIPVWKRQVAMVYQQFINYPHLNVFENIAFPLKQRKLGKEEINDRVKQAIEQVGLVGFENRKIQALSGGQQQRVALARSLVKNANILLLDEPLVNLDYKLREQLREEFKKIFSSKASEEAILIYTTTDPVEAMQLGGEVIVMDEGKILQQGSAKEIYENPITTKVAEITNDPAMNLFKGEIKGKKIKLNSKIELSLPKHFKDLTDGHYTFGIRASGITLAKSGFPFQIELAEISGSETFLHLGQGQVHVVGLLDAVKNFDIGETVSVIFDIEKLYAFGSDGILMSSPYSGTK
ncbi:ABC transporter ATP-binding protein [Amylibacter sp.]|nr:ABC transporter ATP-binding protein [Amylibacter sp.]MDB2337455.1 ABC transporter ATP-binding protein [Amylibacter sp.]MDB4248863.1 ABC transporter ATP-binding protein [Amylibacter sp.]MDB9918901.1 ABC transporter ATP-binding protein [Amylibacter sp.]